ncbi:MAG TPA: 50S ribosomal protein L11 methyltransferase [Pyrinomonadaceae bacterium]
MDWHAIDLEVEPTASEAVQYALMEAGALGTETIDRDDKLVQITGYFAELPERERVRQELLEALRIYELPSSSVRDMNLRQVANRDWLEEWKESWQPVEVGRFIIAPPWSDVPQSQNQVLIRIEPGMAFGTGTHETTRLCLRAIDKQFTGNRLLDVGTGTGILAISAAKMNPVARIEACDTDAEAIAVAHENAALNKVGDRIIFKVGSVEDSTPSADLVCANLTADVIVQTLPKLIGVTCGSLILSGILSEQRELVQDRLLECGVTSELEIMEDGEWVAIIVKRIGH